MPSGCTNVDSALAPSSLQTAAKKSKLSASNHRRMLHQEKKKESESLGGSSQSTKKALSEQEKKSIDLKLKKQRESMEHCNHVLSVLTRNVSGPEFWLRPEYKQIRQCIEVFKSHPHQFKPVIGDELPDGSIFCEDDSNDGLKLPALTSSYILSIATFKDLPSDLLPIMQVVSSKMTTETSSMKQKRNNIHFTHLRLRDGSNDVIIARLSMNVAHDGSKLGGGDIIRLSNFTPLTFTPSGRDNPQRSPALVIHTYAKIGYSSLPIKLNPPLQCVDASMSEQIEAVLTDADVGEIYFEDDNSKNNSEWEPLVEVSCTPTNRYCAKYGVCTILCLCVTDPVTQIDLEVVKQFCYFATKEVSKMTNSNKRNMLYWWYMTNTYNICGKGTRADPPECLKAAIRKAYPSERPDGMFKKYMPGTKLPAKKNCKKKK